MTDIKSKYPEFEGAHLRKPLHSEKKDVKWHRDRFYRLHNMAGDPHSSLEASRDVSSQTEASDKTFLEQLSQWSKCFSTINKSFNALTKDIRLLSWEEQKAISTQLKEAYQQVKLAFDQWKTEHILTKASDDQSAIKLEKLSDDLNKAFNTFESLKQETQEKLEKIGTDLDERFKDATSFYKEFSEASQKRLLREKSEALTMDDINKLIKTYKGLMGLIKKHERLTKGFTSQRENVRGNYGKSSYSDCKRCLDKLEAVEDETIKIACPAIRNTVSQEMKPIREDVSSINDVLNKYGIKENPYSPEALQGCFEEIERETLRKLLLAKPDSANHKSLPPSEIFDELKPIASEVHQAREGCEMVDKIATRVRSTMDRIRNTGAQQGFDRTWEDKFQQKLDDALQDAAQGTHGQAFKDLQQIALDLHPKKKPAMEENISRFEKSKAWMDQMRCKFKDTIDSMSHRTDHHVRDLGSILKKYDDDSIKFEEMSTDPDAIYDATRIVESMEQECEIELIRVINKPWYDRMQKITQERHVIEHTSKDWRDIQEKEINAYRSIDNEKVINDFKKDFDKALIAIGPKAWSAIHQRSHPLFVDRPHSPEDSDED